MVYQPTFFVVENGYIYSLKVHLNRMALFTEYFHTDNSISVDGSLVSKEDIGTYMIVFVGEFTNGID